MKGKDATKEKKKPKQAAKDAKAQPSPINYVQAFDAAATSSQTTQKGKTEARIEDPATNKKSEKQKVTPADLGGDLSITNQRLAQILNDPSKAKPSTAPEPPADAPISKHAPAKTNAETKIQQAASRGGQSPASSPMDIPRQQHNLAANHLNYN